MYIEPTIALAGLVVGFIVGLTGMGGGALMTPILILAFRVHPLTAVSSDLVASFFMKPVGGAVHLRRGTVHMRLVAWLIVGSVPAAFAGVFVLRLLGHGPRLQQITQTALGAALLVAAGAIVLKAVIGLRRPSRRGPVNPAEIPVKPIPTILVGAVGGLVVGMTSVGSGSLIIVCLLFLYPRLRASQLVGTDLIQAIPLVGAAAVGHLLYGDFQLALTTSLLLGAIPGAYLGAKVSAQAPGHLVRRALAFVLLATALKLLQVGTVPLAIVLVTVAIAGEPSWRLFVRASNSLLGPAQAPAEARQESAA